MTSDTGTSDTGASDTGRLSQIVIALAASLAVGATWWVLPHPAVAVAAALAPMAVVFSLRVPFVLCLGFVIFSFFRIHEAFPVLLPLRLPQLLALPTLLALGWHMVFTKNIRPYWSPVLTLFAVFFGLVTIGVVFAVNRPTAMAYWTATYVKIAVMVLAIAWLTTRPADFGRAARLFVVAGMAVAWVTLSNKARGIGLVEGTRVTIGRDIQSVLGDPNDLSLVLLFPISFAAGLLVTSGVPRLTRLLALAGFVMMLAAVIATQSRGGLLGTLAVMGIVGSRVIRSKAVLMTVGAVALAGLFAVAGISGRSSGGAGESGIDESSMGRIYAWGAATQMALSRPLTGVGLDNFVPNYYLYSSHWDGMNHAVHSTWFGVLGETGFPGLIVFVLLIGRTIHTAFRTSGTLNRQHAPPDARAMGTALVAGLPAFCVAGSFLTQGFTWPVYIQLALTVALARYAASKAGWKRITPAGTGSPNETAITY